MNRTFKLDNLIVLVDLDTAGKIYPRVFLSVEEAEECARIVGGKWKIQHCFINENPKS
jgi:hypothetical protein